jgi:NAD(P)-dependent dehydrogenase (short-subunit alcohol dehydrogenase family)
MSQPASENATFDVAGRVAIVTGASSGLGRRMAHVLHSAGARVTAVGRRQGNLDELGAELPGILCMTADVGDDEALERIAAATIERFGGVDILVNNAATVIAGRGQEELRPNVERTLAVNVVAPMRLAQLVYPGMAKQHKGSIINVTSILSHVGVGRIPQASYAASKGALTALTRELATQWARDGIRVNAIAPGFFASEMSDQVVQNEKLQDYIVRNTPLARIGTPSEFDGALLFLASDASSFVTGQSLVVDGGWTAR